MTKKKAVKVAKVVTGRTPRFETGAQPGNTLKREYHGKIYTVRVVKEGFHYNGETYTSLSKIAGSITAQSTNGPLWFGLRQPAKKTAKPGKVAKVAAKGGKKALSAAADAAADAAIADMDEQSDARGGTAEDAE